ncbi:hypothetical protein KQX54_016656 [Cotesia glomerata]|uniref:Uncharacterized protein n=1 Tax=Cotesia glomerata TaxID=32391 RepID=A0AAV7IX47_COTGL|nr:hypothetical protein KQX54_016656 [Cotesia glomerata]
MKEDFVRRYFSRSVPADKGEEHDSSLKDSHLQVDASSITSREVKPQQYLSHDGKENSSVPPPAQNLKLVNEKRLKFD